MLCKFISNMQTSQRHNHIVNLSNFEKLEIFV